MDLRKIPQLAVPVNRFCNTVTQMPDVRFRQLGFAKQRKGDQKSKVEVDVDLRERRLTAV